MTVMIVLCTAFAGCTEDSLSSGSVPGPAASKIINSRANAVPGGLIIKLDSRSSGQVASMTRGGAVPADSGFMTRKEIRAAGATGMHRLFPSYDERTEMLVRKYGLDRWYYLSALANMSLGNRAVAEDHIRTAYAKDPSNSEYRQAYESITQGINPLDYNPFSSFFDFSDFTQYENNENYHREYSSGRRPRSCLGRILRIILIIIVIRLVLRLIFSVSDGRLNYRNYRQSNPSYSYSQQYDYTQDSADILGEDNGERQDM